MQWSFQVKALCYQHIRELDTFLIFRAKESYLHQNQLNAFSWTSKSNNLFSLGPATRVPSSFVADNLGAAKDK